MTDKKAYIQVYTGNGKGKTTAAFGLALRAAGRGLRTYFAQFMKLGDYGEVLAAEKFLSGMLQVEQFGLPGFHHSNGPVSGVERRVARNGLQAVREALQGGAYQLVVMDEVNTLLWFGIVELSEVLEIMDQRPPDVELVLTGRYAPQEVLERADLISEMKEIKHYYAAGVEARDGIER